MTTATSVNKFGMALVFIVVALVSAQPALTADDATGELIAAEKTLAASVVALDFATLENLYADDFVFSHSTGVVETKADWLKYLKDNPTFYTSRLVDSIKVELHGDVAVTNGRLHIKTSSENPERQEFLVWYIRVYEHRDNQWQLLSHRSIREQLGPLDN